MSVWKLNLEEERDAGSSVVTRFSIPEGLELEAASDLCACLAEGAEVCLRNDLDEGLEGLTCFRLTRSSFEFMIGGHGWRSGWKPIDEAGIRAEVTSLAQHNRGGNWSHCGTIRRPKGSAQR